METISFVLKPGISVAEKRTLLSAVKEHPDCAAVRSLADQNGLAATSVAARICHARCKDLQAARTLKQFVADQPGVQSVSIESKRGPAED